MGRVVIPKYRVEVRGNFTRMGHEISPMIWRGRVSKKGLEAYRQKMNLSFMPGGVNQHIGEKSGYLPHISFAKIVRQRDGHIMTQVMAPMFEAI